MDKITATKKELRLKSWAKMYAEYQSSGKTVSAWCNECVLSIKMFYYRLRKIREAAMEQAETHQIVPITANEISSAHEPTSIKIHSNGITIELSENISTETITAVLRGLQ